MGEVPSLCPGKLVPPAGSLPGEGTGQTNIVGSFLPSRRRHEAVRKEGVQSCTGWVGGTREQGAASFTFTLSSGAHGKALLALAEVGARSVDASLSSAGRGLLTFISIWQQTGRQPEVFSLQLGESWVQAMTCCTCSRLCPGDRCRGSPPSPSVLAPLLP